MDQFSRRIIGFAVHKGDVDGIAVCCLFNKIISKMQPPKYLSSDHDPLFAFLRWRANLNILDIKEIKTVPHVPLSHPFVERLILSTHQECLDRILFWIERNLQRKLDTYKDYFNGSRSHMALNAVTPKQKSENRTNSIIKIDNYRWDSYCGGLFQLTVAA